MAATGSIQAADGSTISWSTANDVVTAKGSNGRKMVLSPGGTPNPGAPPMLLAQADFYDSEGPYYRQSRQIIPSQGWVNLQAVSLKLDPVGGTHGTYDGASMELLIDEATLDQGIEATIRGSVSGNPFSWVGRVPLNSTPTALLDKFGVNAALAPLAEKASYFGDALKVIVPQTTSQASVTAGGVAIRATAWGLAAVAGFAIGTLATGGTLGAVGLISWAGIFLTGADASLVSDATTQLEDGAASEDGGCFAAGTLIMGADGYRYPIEALEVGDIVASRHEESRADGKRQILRTWMHRGKPTVDLHLSNSEVIRATTVHRMFTEKRGLVAVGDLEPGERLLTRDSGPVAIKQLTVVREPVNVHNLTIEGYNTYFVGETGVWVHNDKICIDPDTSDIDPYIPPE